MEINFFRLGTDSGDSGCYFRDMTSPEDAELVLVSAPWGVTSASGEGSAYAPDAIIDSSAHIAEFDASSGFSFGGKIATAPIDYDIQENSQRLGADAEKVISHVEDGGVLAGEYFSRKVARINEGFVQMHESIRTQTAHWLAAGKKVGIIGGDHTVGFGAIEAVAAHEGEIGVLYIDAFCDMHLPSESLFEYSHLSAARNIMEEIPSVGCMVQVGVRDVGSDEYARTGADNRIALFLMDDLVSRHFGGESWSAICDTIIARLPQKVYVSVDVAALSLDCFPHSKQPVAGGLSFNETVFLINRLAASGREIVGFDMTGIVPKFENNIDAVAGARLLAKLCCAVLKR
ncbi:MAG: arginase family protein [Alistipes sp.]